MIIYYYFVWFFIINACSALDYTIIVTAVDFVGSMTPSSVYANVGDRIVFLKNQYSIGNFSIVEADTQGSCVQTTRPNAFTAQLSDTQTEAVLNLATPGIFYFFDAVSQRCSYGSRLVVHVAASSGSTSTSYNQPPIPTSQTNQPPIPTGQTNQPLSTNSPLNNNNNNNDKSTSNGPSIGIIIGIVGGVLFVLAILFITVVFFVYRNKNNNKDNNNNNNTNYNNRSNDYNNNNNYNNYSGNYNNNNNFVNSNYNNGSNNYNNSYNNGNNNYNGNYNNTNDDYNSNQHEVLEIPSSDDRNLLTQPR